MLHDDIALVRSRMILDLHRYWSSLLGGRAMPAKRDLDPSLIKPILPYLLMAEIVGERPRVRYRLVGTEIALANGYDFTDRWLDELDFNDDVDGGWRAQYAALARRARPLFGTAAVFSTTGLRLEYEFALLPLSEDGVHVHFSLGIEDYSDARERTRDDWRKGGLRGQRAVTPA